MLNKRLFFWDLCIHYYNLLRGHYLALGNTFESEEKARH